MGCKKKSVLIGLAALGTALVLLPFLFRPVKPSPTMPSAEETRAVRLVNRVISVPCASTNHWAFPEPSAFSRRGTAPVVIVTKERVTAVERKHAAACGARVTGVIPPYGIVAEVDASAVRRLRADGSFVAAEPLRTSDKMSDSLKQLVAAGGAGTVPVTMVPLAAEDAETVAASIEAAGGQPYEISKKGRGFVRADIPAQVVAALAARGDVRWAERHIRPRLLNNVAVQPGLMNVTPVRDMQGLTGKGQTITVSDSGLDTGDPNTIMADFTNRIAFMQTVDGCLSYDSYGHGTHVAGSLAGDGSLSGGEFKGVACEAVLNVWQCFASDGNLYIPESDLLFQPDKANSPSYIHSGSWGESVKSAYDAYCVDIDEWMWRHPENLAVFAAGNNGTARSICSPAGAKNVIAVGATGSRRPEKGTQADNPSAIASFSSKGPMADGRIKPDVCAPGSYILSTRSTQTTATGKGLCPTNSSYMFDSGTSMATPFVSGSAALVRQWLVERRGFTNELPTAALMKAVLAGGAHDMVGDVNASCGGAAPNSSQGWGRVDLGESLYPTNAEVKLVDRIPFEDGETFAVRVTTTNAAPLAVQLAWTDYPGDYGAAQALVNDLDLVVFNETTGAAWYGNGVEGGDHTNSMESVRIASAEAGAYTVMVRGVSVPYDCMEGGAAALYVRGAFSEADATNVVETVQLTVSVEGDVTGNANPSVGTHRVTKGTPVSLEAEAVPLAAKGDTVTHRHMVAGWSGTGDVPASGEGGRVVVRLERDSGISWRWNSFTNVLLRSYWYMPNYDSEYFYLFREEWPRLGEPVVLTVPESAFGGSEAIDLSDEEGSYIDFDGIEKTLGVQRLGRIEIAETDADDFESVVDVNGHMATWFSITMDKGEDVLYCYFDEASTNVATTLPTWWYQRYVAENPAANQVWFTSVSPSRLEWTGGAGLTRVLERTPVLGASADWQPVYTNAPEPVLTNVWEVPSAFSTNSFYRIVW